MTDIAKILAMPVKELADRIGQDYTQDVGFAVDTVLLAMIIREFAGLESDQERELVFTVLREFFCFECGSDRLPCSCMKDE